MDGRVQLPVIEYLQNKFGKLYIDMITEPGPNLIISENTDEVKLESILFRTDISVNIHESKGIAIVGHADCAGNPNSEMTQKIHLRKSKDYLENKYPSLPIYMLWVDESFLVREIE
jgi:hypothetical protein